MFRMGETNQTAAIRRAWRERLPISYIARTYGLTETQVQAIVGQPA